MNKSELDLLSHTMNKSELDFLSRLKDKYKNGFQMIQPDGSILLLGVESVVIKDNDAIFKFFPTITKSRKRRLRRKKLNQ
jgi:hypothetical protein